MTKKPTVIIFSTFYEPWMSGAERCVKEVVERLTPRYHFVLFTARISRAVPAYEKRDGCEVRRLGIGHRQIDKWLFCILAPLAAWGVRSVAIHAVMESYAGIALWIFGWLKPRTKRILTLQSADLDSEEKQRRIPDWLWVHMHRSPHRVTAISHFLATRAERLGVAPARISVIPNGVDLSRITPRNPSERVPHRIVCVARLSWEKGLPHLLDAVAMLRRKISDAHLVLVGEGMLRAELMAQAEHLGIQDAVTFRGHLPNDEVLAVIKTAQVFVCPSLAEGFGIVFVEAQAAGVPVIGTRVGGIPDVVADGETGLLVPPKDPAALAVALERFLTDDALGERCVIEALHRLPHFDWRKIAEQFALLYREVAMPRVLLATSIYPPDIGGPASFAAQFAAAWAARRHSVTVVAPQREATEQRSFHVAPLIHRATGRWGYVVTLFRAAKEADVLFAQDASSYSILASVVAALRRLPFVVRLGGDLLWERDAAVEKITVGITAYYANGVWRQAAGFHRLALRRILRFAVRLIFPNALLPKLYRDAFDSALPHATVIMNPIADIHVVRPAVPKRQLLLSGRMIPLKNFLPTLAILAAVRKEEGVQPFSVVLIGNGPLLAAIEEWKQAQAADWLHLHSSMDRAALFLVIAESWCVAQLSWAEVSPNLAIEALQLGIPVLLTNDNGLARELAPYTTLVSPTDANAVQSAFREILGDEGHARAVQRAAAFFWPQTTETMMDQYEELFLSLER